MKNQHVALCTANIGLYVPFDFIKIPNSVQEGLMNFKEHFTEMAKSNNPEVDFTQKHFRENLLLFMDMFYENGAGTYDTDFSLEMEAWFTDPETGNVIYYDNSSEGFRLELSAADVQEIKLVILSKLAAAFN